MFNSIGDFFYRGSIDQKRASLEGRVTVANTEQHQPLIERQQLLTTLEAWHPNCPEEAKTRVMLQIIECYDQGKTFITFDSSSIDSIPDVFALGGFANLTSFNANICHSLTALPESLGNLKVLTSLTLNGCNSLKTLPESIGNLTALTNLDIRDCGSLIELPTRILSLSTNCSVDLRGCSRFSQEIREFLSNAIRVDTYRGPRICCDN